MQYIIFVEDEWSLPPQKWMKFPTFLAQHLQPRYIHQQAEAQHAHGTEMAHSGTQKQTETDLGDLRNFLPTQTKHC